MLTDITADELADEYVRQFDGYDHLTVERAVTAAIGKATGRPPSPGQIKAEIRAVMTAKPDTSAYSYKPSPEIQKRNTAAYEAWRVKDDELTREAAEKARNMSPETLKRLGIDPQGIGTRALKRRGAERED